MSEGYMEPVFEGAASGPMMGPGCGPCGPIMGGYEGPVYTGGPTFLTQISKFVGETVTIFTTSGGQSGSGFTGILTLVTPTYIRLAAAIALPPSCGLGNACCGSAGSCGHSGGKFTRGRSGFVGGFCGYNGLGSMVDIPVVRIAAFVHNTV